MAQDHYRVLGIEPDASEADIKRAFRSLAHAYHPDKEGGDEILFKRLTLAYSVLSNERSRSEYDSGPASGAHKATETPPPPVRPRAAKAVTPIANQQVRNGVLIASIVFFIVLLVVFNQESEPSADTTGGPSSGLPTTNQPALTERLEAQQPVPEIVVLGSQGMSSQLRPVTFSGLSMINLGKRLPDMAGNNFGYWSFSERTVQGTFWKVSFTMINDSTQTVYARYSLPVLTDQAKREFRPEQVYTCKYPYGEYGRVQTSLEVWNVLSEQIPLKPGIPCEVTFLFEVSDLSTEFLLTGEFE